MNLPDLSTTLLVNLTLSALSGAVLVAGGHWVAPVLGTVPVWVYQLLGAGLLLFALGVFCVYRKLPESQPWVIAIFALDLLWVLATPLVMVVFYPLLTVWAHSLLVATAVLVTFFAFLEWHWWRQPASC
jgi:hypothetical protein